MSAKLLILGGDPAAFAPALASGASLVSLDLEDTVPDDRKPATRALIPSFLAQARAAGCRAGLRISPLSTRDGLIDLLMLHELAALPDVLVLTKVESAAEMRLYENLLDGRCASLPLSVIIETPRAIHEAEAIALSSTRIESLSFGGKDLSRANRMERSWEPLSYARSRLVNAAAMAGLDVYDEPYHPRDDLEGLRQNCLRVKAMGFTGKSTTDPRHPAVIRTVFDA